VERDVRTFPQGDGDFQTAVERALARLAKDADLGDDEVVEGLEAALRATYPAVMVRVGDPLGSLREPPVYAYRFGSPTANGEA
jgi:hypothetical protein